MSSPILYPMTTPTGTEDTKLSPYQFEPPLPDLVFSDEEESSTEDETPWGIDFKWDRVQALQLKFGKHKGKTFNEMICKRSHRDYLRYLLKWDELNATTRHFIEVSLATYEKARKAAGATKSEKKKKKKSTDEATSAGPTRKKRKSRKVKPYDL